jgi:pimeloyl-ACP methyl ester carboxylesterase
MSVDSAWSDAAVWADDDLHREVFFFEAGGEELFGSLYASKHRSRAVGLVLCSSWGIEAHRMCRVTDALARKAAQLGGAALLFHYPGYGDSTGLPERNTIESLVAAGVAAAAEASGRQPELTWGFAGVRLGASVAALAQRAAGMRHLLLIQPALDPKRYFEEMLANASRAMLGRGRGSKVAFGYPVPEAILHHPSVAFDVSRELSEFDGERAVTVQYRTPTIEEPALERFERVTVSGKWHFGLRNYPDLKRGALEALRQVMGSAKA